jgi:hypothetical protein
VRALFGHPLLFAYLQKPVLLKPVSLVLERMMLFAFPVVVVAVVVASVAQQEAACDTYLAGAAAMLMLMLMLMLMHPILQFVSRASCYHLFVTAVGEAVVAVAVAVAQAQAQVEVEVSAQAQVEV